MKASEIMTRKVIAVEPDASILQAVHLMLQNRISGLPVIDATGNLVGILSEGDLLRRQEMGTQKRRVRWVELFMSGGREYPRRAQSRGSPDLDGSDVGTGFRAARKSGQGLVIMWCRSQSLSTPAQVRGYVDRWQTCPRG